MNIKRLLVVLLAAVLVLTMASCSGANDTETNDDGIVAADENVYEGFTYKSNIDGTYELVSFEYTGVKPITVTIPTEIEGRDVTGIGADLFKAMKTVEKVVFPAGSKIEYIGEYAFYDCDLLTEIVLPETVTSIGMGAFQDCSALKSVNIPAGITEIRDFTFLECSALESISIPESVTVIGRSAFRGCASITSVVLPEALTDMGDAAFYECAKLESATVLSTKLGLKRYDENKNPIEIHNIGEIVFKSCSDKLVIIVTPDSPFAEYAANNGYKVENPAE